MPLKATKAQLLLLLLLTASISDIRAQWLVEKLLLIAQIYAHDQIANVTILREKLSMSTKCSSSEGAVSVSACKACDSH